MKRFDKTYSLNCGVEMRMQLIRDYIIEMCLKTDPGRHGPFVQAGDSTDWAHNCMLLIGVPNISPLITALQELQQFIQEERNDT